MSPRADLHLRWVIVEGARRMNALRINHGTSGNVSARYGEGMLITPSALSYDHMDGEDIVEFASLDSRPRGGRRRPSTEWRLHAGIYAARPMVGAIVHAHPMHATSLACLRRGIPAFHYLVAAAGGSEIRCSRYATFGSPDLAAAAVEALGDLNACLLANHGIVTCGRTVAQALALAVEVEALATLYWHALQVGEPVLLTDEEMTRVLRLFEHYRPDASGGGTGP